MEPAPITIRPANPTHEEGLAFARFVDIASEGGLRYALGSRFSEILATAFPSPAHDLSYEYAVFAETDSVVAGMAAGYTAEQHLLSTDEPLRLAPGSRLWRGMSLAFLRAFMGMLADHAPGDFYLGFLAVDASARGKGVGSALVDHMEARAREAGCRRFTLDVSAKNPGAERLYARHGLSVEPPAQKRNIRTFFVRRMVKEL